MGRLGHQPDEIPEGVVRAGGLRVTPVGFHFHRMDEVGKLDRILNEKHRDVVADQVPIALAGVEFNREAAHVARGINRAGTARHGGKAGEHRRAGALGEQRRLGEIGNILSRLEIAMRRRAAGMDDALGNALVIEVEDFLAHDKVLQQHRPARARFQLVLVIRDMHALIVRQRRRAGHSAGGLVSLAPVSGSGFARHFDLLGCSGLARNPPTGILLPTFGALSQFARLRVRGERDCTAQLDRRRKIVARSGST